VHRNPRGAARGRISVGDPHDAGRR
jgi:hypothetical protein